MSDHFRTTYFALDPNGIVHRIQTRTIGDLRALDGFRRKGIVHGYSAKDKAEVVGALESKIFEKVLGRNAIKHDIQNAFLEANGTFVDHESPDAFFDAIGYVGSLRRRCESQFARYMEKGKLPGGGFAFIDSAPFEVKLPGYKAGSTD